MRLTRAGTENRQAHPACIAWIVLALFVALFAPAALATGPDDQPSQPAEGAREEAAVDPVARLVERVAAAGKLPEGLSFTQRVTVRLLLLRWEFASRLKVQDSTLHVTTDGAPGFIPESLPRDLVELSGALHLFDLHLVGEDEGLVLLEGLARNYSGQGARAGKFWVDTARGHVVKADVEYEWGTLHLIQEYGPFREHSLLKRQSARLTPYPATLDVRYDDYAFATP